jgi:hypothetical protein
MRSIFATVADCRAFNGGTVPPSQEALILNNGAGGQGRYIFLPTSASPDNNAGQLVIVPTAGTGRWIRRDPIIDLVLPVTSATADAAQLCLVPAELTLAPAYAAIMLEVTTVWAGGTAAALGLSMVTPSIARNKGALAGAAAGTAGFTSVCFFQLTLGSQFAPGIQQAPILCPASQIQFDRFGAVFFTSGAGNLHVPCYNYFTSITPVTPP